MKNLKEMASRGWEKAKEIVCKVAVGVGLGIAGAASTGTASATASSYTSAFSDASDQISLDITTIIPYALALFALSFGVRYVVRVFKSTSR